MKSDGFEHSENRFDRTVRVLIAFVGLAVLVSFAQFHIRNIVTGSIAYDDAVNANAAKNLAMGLGYSTSYHEIVPFDPNVTTGPIVLLPAAALMRIFGNAYWVPHLASTLSIWATLTLVLGLHWRRLTRSQFWGACALIVLGLMLFLDEFGLLGEMPAAFLAWAAILVLCSKGEALRGVFIAGLLLGLAINAKLITALVLPAVL